MGYLLYRYFPDARGSGVPQTKAALFAREGNISLATVIGKFFCTSATLASGIPLGREGPAVQVGAGIASVLGRWLGLRTEKVKALLPVGATAAIAAAFNTPLAAVLFSLEEVVGNLHAPILGSVVLASATSWAMLRLLLGNNPLFQVPQYQLVNPAEFGIYAVLGVAGGLVSVAFTKLLLGMRARFLKFPKKTLWFQPAVGGLTVGIMGWFVPQLLGVGYARVGSEPVSWRNARRSGGQRRESLLPPYCGNPGRLCAGRNGHGVCGDRARAHDLGADDFRDYAGLRGDCAADDFQPGESFHFGKTTAETNL